MKGNRLGTATVVVMTTVAACTTVPNQNVSSELVVDKVSVPDDLIAKKKKIIKETCLDVYEKGFEQEVCLRKNFKSEGIPYSDILSSKVHKYFGESAKQNLSDKDLTLSKKVFSEHIAKKVNYCLEKSMEEMFCQLKVREYYMIELEDLFDSDESKEMYNYLFYKYLIKSYLDLHEL